MLELTKEQLEQLELALYNRLDALEADKRNRSREIRIVQEICEKIK